MNIWLYILKLECCPYEIRNILELLYHFAEKFFCVNSSDLFPQIDVMQSLSLIHIAV